MLYTVVTIVFVFAVVVVVVMVVVVMVVRIFVSHSNLYQSYVRNDGWHLSMSDIFVFHFSFNIFDDDDDDDECHENRGLYSSNMWKSEGKIENIASVLGIEVSYL